MNHQQFKKNLSWIIADLVYLEEFVKISGSDVLRNGDDLVVSLESILKRQNRFKSINSFIIDFLKLFNKFRTNSELEISS